MVACLKSTVYIISKIKKERDFFLFSVHILEDMQEWKVGINLLKKEWK